MSGVIFWLYITILSPCYGSHCTTTIDMPEVKNPQEAAQVVENYKEHYKDFVKAELWRYDGKEMVQVPIPPLAKNDK